MTAQELKNSILQLAIQGKLVKQDPNDEPASVLLEKIKEERKKLIEEKKIKKEKYSEIYKDSSDNHYYEKFEDGTVNDITDEIPFEIPESWKWIRFNNLVHYRMGKTPPRGDKQYWKNDYNWVSIADMIDNGIVNNTKERISKKAFEEKFSSLISPKNTLIMSFKLTVGKVSILGKDALHNEAIISIFPYYEKDFIIRNYLFKFLPLLSNYGKTKDAIKGKTLNSTSLNNLLIPLPPINEQKQIVINLDKFNIYIQKYDNIYNKLERLNFLYKEELKKSILQYAIQGKLVKQNLNDEPAEVLINKILEEKRQLMKTKQIKKENLSVIYKDTTDNQFYEKFDDGKIVNITDEIPFDIPDTWQWTRLNNIVKSINAGGDKPKIFSKNITEKNVIPVISNGEKNEGIFGFTDKPVISEKSLTISGRGTIGYSKIRTIPYVPIVRLLVLIPLTNTNLEYIQLSIQALIERGVGTAVKQLTVPMIKPKLIPTPPLSEQKKILEIFNKFIKIIEK